MNLYVSLIQANKEECESREEAERRAESERLRAKQRDERVRLAVEEEVRRSAVLTEWERTWSPPQSEEVCLLLLPFFSTCLSYTISYNSCLYSDVPLYPTPGLCSGITLAIHILTCSCRCYRLFMRCGLSCWKSWCMVF